MFSFENKKTEGQKVHYSRYIASWKNAGGHYYGEQFEKWLRSNGLTEQEISDVKELANCGKMELEVGAKFYVNKMRMLMMKIENDEEPEEEP